MQQVDDVPLSDEQRRAADAGLKAMLPIAGRPFLDYVLSSLADAEIARVALIVAPDHDAVRRHYVNDNLPERIKIDFIVQHEPTGTAPAVLAAEAWTAEEPFLVLNGDNLYPVDVIRDLCGQREPACPVFSREELIRTSNIPADRVKEFALLDVDASGYVSGIIEKPSPDRLEAAGRFAGVSMNCWRFDARIFTFCREVPRSARGEFELPEAVGLGIERGLRVRAIPGHGPVLDLSRRADVAAVQRRLAGLPARP